MTIMRCKMSFTDAEAKEHAVEVEAESFYDAVGLAIVRFHEAPGEMLCIELRSRFTVEIASRRHCGAFERFSEKNL
jgi:hypothetical protein